MPRHPVHRGHPSPLGATPHPGGVNFSIWARDALSVELLLFDRADDARPSRVVELQRTEHRTYPDTPTMKRVLQAIWHQVSTAGEVFSVGTILPDKTAHGGTGWAVELARHWMRGSFGAAYCNASAPYELPVR